MHHYRVAVVGGGPAGLAPLLALHRRGELDALLAAGLVVFEQSAALGQGSIGDYAIASDSTGKTFVDCLNGTHRTRLTALREHPLALELALVGDGPAPLELVGRFMALVGGVLQQMIAAHPACAVLTGRRVVAVHRTARGWCTVAVDRTGRRSRVTTRDVIGATGACQTPPGEPVGGVVLGAAAASRMMQSGTALTGAGLEEIARRLQGTGSPRVAVVGGSTSAIAVAHALLHRLPGVAFGPGGVTVLHRRPLRVTYGSAAEALAEGYDEFDANDICPISGRVFRFAGFRLDSRELVMQARGIGGRPAEPRLRLHTLGDPAETAAILDRADLIITALGYRPRGLPLQGADRDPIELLAHVRARAPLVDDRCRMLDSAGQPIEGVYGIGLAAGFVPRGDLGGEPSFVGQANGLWLWQNDVGLLIARAVLDDDREDQPVPIMGPADERPLPALAE